MPKIAFNNQNLASINVKKATWYSDSSKRAVRGLRLMAGATKKTWYLNRRESGKVRQVKLGTFPEMNVERARMTANGTTFAPAADQPEATLQDHLDAYIEHRREAGKLAAGTERDYRDLFRRHAPDWLEAPLVALTTYAVEERFNSLRDRPGVANKLVTVLRCVNKYATRHDELKRDPTSAVTALHTLRPRRVRCEDLEIVMCDVLAVSNPVKRAAWQLLLHTGLRSTNLRTMEWDMVDLDAGTMRVDRLKNGEARTFPLSDHSVALFESVRRYDDTFCLPSFKRPGPIDHLDALEHCNQHDMRRWFTSVAAQAGIERDVRMWLRGDVTREAAIDHYNFNIATREAVNAISLRLNDVSGFSGT